MRTRPQPPPWFRRYRSALLVLAALRLTISSSSPISGSGRTPDAGYQHGHWHVHGWGATTTTFIWTFE